MIKMCIKHYWENADAEIPVLNRSEFCNPKSDSIISRMFLKLVLERFSRLGNNVAKK
jgi:hypothetical protein